MGRVVGDYGCSHTDSGSACRAAPVEWSRAGNQTLERARASPVEKRLALTPRVPSSVPADSTPARVAFDLPHRNFILTLDGTLDGTLPLKKADLRATLAQLDATGELREEVCLECMLAWKSDSARSPTAR